MCYAVKNQRGDRMTKLDITGLVVLGVAGLFAITLAISIAPDIRRYLKISRM